MSTGGCEDGSVPSVAEVQALGERIALIVVGVRGAGADTALPASVAAAGMLVRIAGRGRRGPG